MISNKHRVIYLHIPRTAGSVIENIFEEKQIQRYTYFSNGKQKKFAINQQHALSCEAKQLYKKEWNSYLKFTFVRNPWDRMVSLFFHLKKVKLLEENIKFNNFINIFIDKTNKSLNERHKNMGLPSTEWITNSLDFIGEFENFVKDFAKLQEIIKLKKDIKIPHLNKTIHKPYTEYYSNRTKEIIETLFSKDIELFKYKFGD